jgi:hypothetical protein
MHAAKARNRGTSALGLSLNLPLLNIDLILGLIFVD